MPDIIVKNKIGARDPKGTTPKDGFHSFSVKPHQPKDRGIKVGRAGRKLIASDQRDEDKSARQKYMDNYDKIFGKKK
jgi:hypothetical protein